MSEPKFRARTIHAVVPEILHWTVPDDRIGYRSDAYAVVTPEGTVLVDPLPLEDSLLPRLGRIRAVCLTASFHQRACWRFREASGAPVWAPEAARGLDGTPDHRYEPDELLPGMLRAIHAPGPAHLHFAFLLDRGTGGAALFSGDLLIRSGDDSPLGFVPDKLVENPARTRQSVRDLLEVQPELLLPAHGAPLLRGATLAMQDALALDARRDG